MKIRPTPARRIETPADASETRIANAIVATKKPSRIAPLAYQVAGWMGERPPPRCGGGRGPRYGTLSPAAGGAGSGSGSGSEGSPTGSDGGSVPATGGWTPATDGGDGAAGGGAGGDGGFGFGLGGGGGAGGGGGETTVGGAAGAAGAGSAGCSVAAEGSATGTVSEVPDTELTVSELAAVGEDAGATVRTAFCAGPMTALGCAGTWVGVARS